MTSTRRAADRKKPVSDTSLKPKAARMPKPGLYWLKNACCSYSIETRKKTGNGFSWKHPVEYEWIIGEVYKDDSCIEVLGSDEGIYWDSKLNVIVEVGPRLEPPE